MLKPKATIQRGIYWFKHDLRLTDNRALSTLCEQVDALLCVFIIDPRWFKASHFQSSHMGQHRWQFIKQSLHTLHLSLATRGQRLVVLKGEPLALMRSLIQEVQPYAIGSQQHPGVYEQQQWQKLQMLEPHYKWITSNEHWLFEEHQLPFTISQLPKHFTPFRKKVEPLTGIEPIQAPQKLPNPIKLSKHWQLELIVDSTQPTSPFAGGEIAAQKHLNHYLFETHHVEHYKQTRNNLDGWSNSSKLSAWLANGSLSARQVIHQLKTYEVEHGENESTHWLYFELLWREYFQWYLLSNQSNLFRFEGVQDKRPLTTFMPQRFKRWCDGETPYPIVNACMKQLNQTGYMSNRGRQLVASCFVHELGLDWRFGAAYFEQQLIDFDVAANWSNWQYLAGVGADPRGHRHFDLDRQTEQHDPNRKFIDKWAPQSNNLPLDQFDAVDWPIV
jgi:deoxyribodipyrimidine photo-lyase